MKLPARFIRGQTLTADRLNDLIEAIRRARPLPGAGVSTRESPDGTFISAAQKQAPAAVSTPFSHRWKVTLTTVADGNGSDTHTLHITPGSLWRDEGAGAADLGVMPDGTSVTTDSDGNWLVENATTGSLYVAEDSPTASIPFPLVFGDPTTESRRVLLRVADLVVASSGATLIQRQVGDALIGAATGLQLGPLVYSYSSRKFMRYMGVWTFDATADRWVFAGAVKSDGSQYPAAEIIDAREYLIKGADGIYAAYSPQPGPTPTRWLVKRTTPLATGITYSVPSADDVTGMVVAHNAKLTYYSDDDTVATEDNVLLYTQVEEANEAAHFEN